MLDFNWQWVLGLLAAMPLALGFDRIVAAIEAASAAIAAALGRLSAPQRRRKSATCSRTANDGF